MPLKDRGPRPARLLVATAAFLSLSRQTTPFKSSSARLPFAGVRNMEEYSAADAEHLLQSASDFANYPGLHNEAEIKMFLNRFPLPVIINALQSKAEVPGLENALVACLETIFKTRYGASLIPQYMTFLQVGLKADSQAVRCLACKTVSFLFENLDDNSVRPAQLLIAYDVYPFLLDCLVTGNEQVAAAAVDAIKHFSSSPEGIVTIFPVNSNEVTDLKKVIERSPSLGRIRVLGLIVKLFSVSPSVAAVVYSSNLLCLLEAEVSNTKDTLVTLNILELLYELAEVEHGSEFLSKTKLLQVLSSIISKPALVPVLRSRAMTISGRMLSKESVFSFVHENSIGTMISSIGGRLESSATKDADEYEAALEALGQIGSSNLGATILVSSSPDAARYVIDAAFDKHNRGRQLAALHAFANIAGADRSENSVILNDKAEENLRQLIYEAASQSSKLTLSGLLLSVFRQEAEIRFAGYRLITGLVARPWCLMEICPKQDIINVVTDANIESTKIGMEARYNCCQAVHRALVVSAQLRSNPALAGIATKLQDAVKRGPYLTQNRREATPTVMTDQRF